MGIILHSHLVANPLWYISGLWIELNHLMFPNVTALDLLEVWQSVEY